MSKTNWKSAALLSGIAVVSLVMAVAAAIETARLPLISSMVPLLVLFLLTFAASGLTVSVTSNDGVGKSRKSIADAFVFLAVMLYAVPPTNTVGPAVLLAAVVGFLSTYRLTNRRVTIFTTGMAVISTFVAASLYGWLLDLFAGQAEPIWDSRLSLDIFLVPLFGLASLQYTLSTVTTACFVSIDAGKFRLLPSKESVVWTLTTQLACAASAVLFYSAIRNKGISYALLGLLITALVHLLYRFNQKRMEDLRLAEAERRSHIEEMATIHMNTIESLAIALEVHARQRLESHEQSGAAALLREVEQFLIVGEQNGR